MREQLNLESELQQLLTARQLNEMVLRDYGMYHSTEGSSWQWHPRIKPTQEQAADYIYCVNSLESFYEGHNQDLTQTEAEEMERRVEEYDALSLDMRDMVYEENGKVGLKNPLGRVLVPAEFDAIPETYSCVDKRWGMLSFCVPVVRDGKYGLYRFNTDKHEGKVLTKKSYNRIYRYFSLWVPYFVCENEDGKIGLLDTLMAREVIPCKMDEIYEAKDSDGCVLFKKDDKYGLMFGNVATAPAFEDIEFSSEDYCRVKLPNDDRWYFIDEDGYTTLDESTAYFGNWYDTAK